MKKYTFFRIHSVKKVLCCCCRNVNRFDTKECASLLMSLASLTIYDMPLVETLAVRFFDERIHNADAFDKLCSRVISSLGKLKFDKRDFWKKIIDVALKKAT